MPINGSSSKDKEIIMQTISTLYLRFDNNSYGGMLSEIYEGIVDTSIAGFVQSIPRYEIADFTQDLFGPDTALFIRRPSKRDLSFRYFWLGE